MESTDLRKFDKLFHTTVSDEHAYDGPYLLSNTSQYVWTDRPHVKVFSAPIGRRRPREVNRRIRDGKEYIRGRPLEQYKTIGGTLGKEYIRGYRQEPYKNIDEVLGTEYFGGGNCLIL